MAAPVASGSAVNMWWRTRRSMASIVARGTRTRASSSTACWAPDRVVVVEVAVGERRGLADVVEERRQAHDRPRRGCGVDRAQRVVPEVLAIDLVLRDAALRGELRRDDREQPGLGSARRSPTDGRGAARRRIELRADPLAREVVDERGVGADRVQRRGLDLDVERRREPHRPEHAQRVLAEPGAGVADRPQDAAARGRRRRRTGRRSRVHRANRRPSAGRSVAARAPRDGVDREVPAGEVGPEVVPELDPVRPPEVGVVVLGAERRDLEHLAVAADRHRPERVLVDGAREQRRAAARDARRSRGPSRWALGPGARRAATRRRRTRRGRCAWSWSRTARTVGGHDLGEARRGVAGRRPRVPSVPAEEEVAPPGLVPDVLEVGREQRVDVAARLERRPDEAEPRLLGRAAALAVVARLAGGDEVLPRVRRRRDGAAARGRASGRWRSRPQYWQVWRSRAKISRRVSFTRGRGRRTWCWSRITDGARNASRTVRIVAWSYSMTSALDPNTSRNARGMLQTLSGS